MITTTLAINISCFIVNQLLFKQKYIISFNPDLNQLPDGHYYAYSTGEEPEAQPGDSAWRQNWNPKQEPASLSTSCSLAQRFPRSQVLFLLSYKRGSWGTEGPRNLLIPQSYWVVGLDRSPTHPAQCPHPSCLFVAAVKRPSWSYPLTLAVIHRQVPGTGSSRSLFRMWWEVSI